MAIGQVQTPAEASDDLADHILAAVGIGNTKRTLRIITPFTVDNESVGVLSRLELNRCAPRAVFALLHGNRALLPMSEVSGEQHTRSSERGKAKCLFPGSFGLPCHSLFSFWNPGSIAT